jgi:hypothetical protein
MQQDNQTSNHKTYRKFFIIVISILLLALFSIATVFILKSVVTNDNNSKAISASEVIKNINASGDIASLSSKLYQKQINNSSSVNYELNNKSYSVSIQTKMSTLFFAVSKSQSNDDPLVQTQITTFMNKYGLGKASSPDNSTNELAYTTFAGYKAVCQLEDANPPANSGMLRSHKISCADKTDIDNEYTAIEKLLAIHDKSQAAIKFTKALRIAKTDKNVSYSTIYLSNDKAQSTLLFATVNDSWEYLGDLSAGDTKYSTGMYIITPEIKAKISDPKYNGLIVQEIH